MNFIIPGKIMMAKYPAFFDDYAFLIQALIQLQEITANNNWLDQSKRHNRICY